MSGGGRTQRLVIVFAVTQTLGYGAMIQCFTVLLVPMAHDLAASRPQIAAASAISTLVGALVAVPIGRLLDRRGGRLLMSTGSIVGTVAVVAWSQATTLTQLYLAFVLVGIGLAMSTYEAAFAVLVATADAAQRGRAILTVTMVAGLATSLYYPLSGFLESELGWRGTLLVLAASLALIAVPAHLWVVPSRLAHRGGAARRSGASPRAALRDPRLWLLGVAFVAQAGSVAAFLLLVVSYLADAGHPARVATTVPVVVGVMQILSRMALPFLAARFSMTSVAVAAFTTQGVGLLLLPFVVGSVPLAVVCVGAVGVGVGVAVIAKPTIVADTFGAAHFASVAALVTVPIALSRAGSPLGAAWLADARFLAVTGTATLLGAAALAVLGRLGSLAAPPATGSPDGVRLAQSAQ